MQNACNDAVIILKKCNDAVCASDGKERATHGSI
jgi:hypothetical protein